MVPTSSTGIQMGVARPFPSTRRTTSRQRSSGRSRRTSASLRSSSWAGREAAEQGDEADEPLGGTRPGRHDWRGWRRRLVPARAWNRGYRLAAYRQCSPGVEWAPSRGVSRAGAVGQLGPAIGNSRNGEHGIANTGGTAELVEEALGLAPARRCRTVRIQRTDGPGRGKPQGGRGQVGPGEAVYSASRRGRPKATRVGFARQGKVGVPRVALGWVLDAGEQGDEADEAR